MSLTLDEFLQNVEDADLEAGKIQLYIPLTAPSGNHYKKPRVFGKGISWYLTPEAQAFKSAVAAIAKGRTISPDSPKARAKVKYRVTVLVVLGKKQRQDADNGLKVGLDALKDAGVIHSDARVQEAIGRVNWNLRPDQGYTVLTAEVIQESRYEALYEHKGYHDPLPRPHVVAQEVL